SPFRTVPSFYGTTMLKDDFLYDGEAEPRTSGLRSEERRENLWQVSRWNTGAIVCDHDALHRPSGDLFDGTADHHFGTGLIGTCFYRIAYEVQNCLAEQALVPRYTLELTLRAHDRLRK